MTGLATTTRLPTDAGRKSAIIAGSVLLHGLVLGVMAWGALGIDARLEPDRDLPLIYLDIEPRPLIRGETVRIPRTPPTVSDRRAATTLADPAVERPSLPQPRLSVPAPTAQPAPPQFDPWRLEARSLRARVAGSLRTGLPGCSGDAARLSRAEQDLCDERFGQRAAAAAPLDNPADAAFAAQGARNLAAYEATRRPLAGGSGLVGPQDGPGSNFGIGVAGAHLDPSLRPDSTENIRTKRDGPR